MSIRTYAVNWNDAWLNTEGDDISGSYVKYKDHQEVVAALESKCAALAAKGMELAAESAAVYGKYNESQMPDRDLVDMQTIQEMHDLCSGVKNADEFLAEVRAQGIDMVVEFHQGHASALHEVDRDGAFRHKSAALDAADIAAQLRQGVRS